VLGRGVVERVLDALEPRLRRGPRKEFSTFSVRPPDVEKKNVVTGLPR
jgi:hypothetical protein